MLTNPIGCVLQPGVRSGGAHLSGRLGSSNSPRCACRRGRATRREPLDRGLALSLDRRALSPGYRHLRQISPRIRTWATQLNDTFGRPCLAPEGLNFQPLRHFDPLINLTHPGLDEALKVFHNGLAMLPPYLKPVKELFSCRSLPSRLEAPHITTGSFHFGFNILDYLLQSTHGLAGDFDFQMNHLHICLSCQLLDPKSHRRHYPKLDFHSGL